MGHVDHGKTTLLDAIIGMRVAEGEAGGITQKVSAYRVDTKAGPVVFFDTPGHEAFTKLRARGAETTDVAVLVVAADDGVMPTTVEAINHIKAASVPIVVALNKIDKTDAKPDRVTQQLMEHDVVPEQYGGDTIVVPVSAKQRLNIDQLLENLALQSEILELKANPKKPGQGTVFDATLDKGRGVVTRVLVQDGTIRTGDVVLAGTSYGKIRAMFDDRGKAIAKAGPSTPIEILGLNEVPNAGDSIHVVQDIKKAQAFAEEHKKQATRPALPTASQTIEDLIRHQTEGQAITVGVIIKAEAQASVEALSKALSELSTEKVKIQIVHTGIGGITESDVNLAVASKMLTTVIGFNVRPQGKAAQLAESEKVQLRLYNIIYEAVDEMKALMLGQLKPTYVEKALGKAEVRQVFNITKVGTIAGCYVIDGSIKRTARARLVRDSVQVWEGKLSSLKRFKEDAKEVAQGYECGIGLEGYNDLKPSDIIEAFELEEVAAKL
jgi:translation initiation factor IF-2